MKWSGVYPGKMMNIKSNVIIDAWLGQILVAGCEIGIFLFTQTMPASVFVSNNISTQEMRVV